MLPAYLIRLVLTYVIQKMIKDQNLQEALLKLIEEINLGNHLHDPMFAYRFSDQLVSDHSMGMSGPDSSVPSNGR